MAPTRIVSPAALAITFGAWMVLTLACYLLRRRSHRAAAAYQEMLAVGLLGLLTVAFFGPLFFSRRAFVPVGGGDMASFVYPMYTLAASSVRAGVMPLWNPYLFSGAPLLADIQSGVFYPLNLLAFVLANPFRYQTLELLVVIHYFLAGVFTYAFARSLSLSRVASLFSAVTFMFSGFLIIHLGHVNMVATAIWLPLALLFAHRTLRALPDVGTREGGAPARWPSVVRNALLTAVVLAVAFFAGHTQLFLYLALVLVAFVLYHAVTRARGGVDAPGRERAGAREQGESVPSASFARALSRTSALRFAIPLGVFVGVAVVAFLLVAVQAIPNAQLVTRSVRSGIIYQQAAAFSLSPAGMVTLIVPQFFGENPAQYWSGWVSTETHGYVGILALMLAVLAILLRRNRQTIFFAGLGVLGLLLALGDATPLHEAAYRLVPGLNMVRAPGRFLVLLDLSVAVLAGFGVQALLREPTRRGRVLMGRLLRILTLLWVGTAVVAVPLAYYALLTSQDKDPVIFHRVAVAARGIALFALFFLLALGLLWLVRYRRLPRVALGAALIVFSVFDLFAAGMNVNPTPDDPTAGFRRPEVVRAIQESGQVSRLDAVTQIEDLWQPDTANLERIDDIWGLWNPMTLARYYDYWKVLVQGRSSSAYDVLNAGFLLARKDTPLDFDKFKPLLTTQDGLVLYRNERAMPRAYVAYRAQVLPDARAVADTIRTNQTDLRSTVLLEQGTPLAGPSAITPARIVARGLNEVRVAASAAREGYLVLSETNYPGWQVSVDGEPRLLLSANYAFRAVYLTPGEHDVRFVFRPRSWEVGRWVSLAAWALVGLLLLLIGYRWRSSPGEARAKRLR